MPRNSKPSPGWRGLSLQDPRIVMRALVGALLAANLVVAVIAFKPFGGSADDLRQDQARLSAQLRQMKARLAESTDHVAKIKIARQGGDEFLTKYIMERRIAPEITVEEITRAAMDAGVRALPTSEAYEAIEGSDTLEMMSITAGFEGPYAALAKMVNTLEKSPRFLIIDSMNLNAPQQLNSAAAGGNQIVNVTLKLLTFVRDDAGAMP